MGRFAPHNRLEARYRGPLDRPGILRGYGEGELRNRVNYVLFRVNYGGFVGPMLYGALRAP